MTKTMKEYDGELGITLHLTDILKDCEKESDEIAHLFLIFDPKKDILSVLCRYKSDKTSDTPFKRDYECSPLTYSIILMGVISSPKFTIGSETELATIAIECGAYRA